MSFKSSLLMAVLATASMLSPAVQATTVHLAADGQWVPFNVSELDSLTGGTEWIDNSYSLSPDFGSALSFDFTITAGSTGTLTVVDADFAGDVFQVFNHGILLSATSAVPQAIYGQTADVGYDFDAALADTTFSRAVYTLGEGSYHVSGQLVQSVQLLSQGQNNNATLVPLNTTTGGVKLAVSAVPEPSTAALVLAALAVSAFVSRRLSSSR